jgi:hypothetical protein
LVEAFSMLLGFPQLGQQLVAVSALARSVTTAAFANKKIVRGAVEGFVLATGASPSAEF